MGLDMSLYGRIGSEGEHSIELAYWRKRYALHEYIKRTSAPGIDEPNNIPLSRDHLLDILQFVMIDEEGQETDTMTISRAIMWLGNSGDRSVIYHASW